MQIIPVLDLRQGVIVHARMGRRDHYRPLQSGLCPGHDVMELCQALLRLGPFATIYIADLDAIDGHGDNYGLIREIHANFPELRIWLDAGKTSMTLARDGLLPVIGTESLPSGEDLRDIFSSLERDACILSLDFNGKQLLGPQSVLRLRALWPRRIIVMCLDRVGADNGPDLDLLNQFRVPGHELYAAGGIRGQQDLETLSTAGIQGALVASALHDGRLGHETLLAMMQR